MRHVSTSILLNIISTEWQLSKRREKLATKVVVAAAVAEVVQPVAVLEA